MEAKGPYFSQVAKRTAVELWKAKVAAQGFQGHQPDTTAGRNHRVLGAEDAEHRVPVEPGGVHDEEAAGRHQWQRQPHQELAQAVQQ